MFSLARAVTVVGHYRSDRVPFIRVLVAHPVVGHPSMHPWDTGGGGARGQGGARARFHPRLGHRRLPRCRFDAPRRRSDRRAGGPAGGPAGGHAAGARALGGPAGRARDLLVLLVQELVQVPPAQRLRLRRVRVRVAVAAAAVAAAAAAARAAAAAALQGLHAEGEGVEALEDGGGELRAAGRLRLALRELLGEAAGGVGPAGGGAEAGLGALEVGLAPVGVLAQRAEEVPDLRRALDLLQRDVRPQPVQRPGDLRPPVAAAAAACDAMVCEEVVPAIMVFWGGRPAAAPRSGARARGGVRGVRGVGRGTKRRGGLGGGEGGDGPARRFAAASARR
jgi:hypothetical protein